MFGRKKKQGTVKVELEGWIFLAWIGTFCIGEVIIVILSIMKIFEENSSLNGWAAAAIWLLVHLCLFVVWGFVYA